MRPFSALTTGHYRVLAACWTVGIVLLVTIPTGDLPKMSSVFGLDKLVHAVLFTGFGILWLRGLFPPVPGKGLSSRHWWGLLLFVGGALFAVATEVYQSVALPARTGNAYDTAADLVGLLIAFGAYYAVQERSAERASL